MGRIPNIKRPDIRPTPVTHQHPDKVTPNARKKVQSVFCMSASSLLEVRLVVLLVVVVVVDVVVDVVPVTSDDSDDKTRCTVDSASHPPLYKMDEKIVHLSIFRIDFN